MKMPPLVLALIAATLVLLVGTALVQATTKDPRGTPVASADNGSPRGLLLLRLALHASGVAVVVVDTTEAFDAAVDSAAIDPRRTVIVVPPPEQSAFSSAEVAHLQSLLKAGARVVVGCDGNANRRKRVAPLLSGTGLVCGSLDEGAKAVDSVDADVAFARRFTVLDRGRVSLIEDRAGLLPWSIADDSDRVVVASAVIGGGELVVLGSMSLLANDGLQRDDNAALLRRLREGRDVVVIDERHHHSRLDAVVARARLQGPGPVTAAVCLALLLVLSLLAWLPRKGVLLDDDLGVAAPGVAARVDGLAALIARTSSSPSSSSSPPSSSSSSSPNRSAGDAP